MTTLVERIKCEQPADSPGQKNRKSVMKAVLRERFGNLIVITGPSGVGKGTVVSKLLKLVPDLTKSVSVTTRARRETEIEGIDYFFKSEREFDEIIETEKFMEWAEFAGSRYGTPKSWVEQKLKDGLDVILEIEVQGAKQIKRKDQQAVLIFLSPPSFEALEQRLHARATEPQSKIALRLNKAKQEMNERHLFHYEVVNDDVEQAVNNLASIVYAERCRIRPTETMSPIYEHNQNP